MPQQRPAIISDPERVDASWLTDVLRFAGSVRDATVTSFTTEVVGTGQMGRNVRFRLEWDGETSDAPPTVVVKFPSNDPKSRATGTAQGVYLKEVRFYQELKQYVGIRTPLCHFAEIAPNATDFVMVMEDLAPAVQGDQLAGCSERAAALALAELAKLHAPRWGDPSLERIEFLAGAGSDGAQLLQAVYQGVWPGFAERYGAQLDADALALSERLGEALPGWILGRTGPLTLVHGDYRLDNMLFGTRTGGYPLTVVDWQTIALGPGAGDASYFLGASLLTPDRRACERELVRGYHEQLCALGVRDYSADACWRDYRRQAFGGVVMAVVASMIVEQTERGDEMFLAMATRHAAHAIDLESEALL